MCTIRLSPNKHILGTLTNTYDRFEKLFITKNYISFS